MASSENSCSFVVNNNNYVYRQYRQLDRLMRTHGRLLTLVALTSISGRSTSAGFVRFEGHVLKPR